MARTRLSPERRREQLLELGSQLFASRPYDEVWIEQVAEQAGVSRGLLYHHFPNKRAFFLATLEREITLLHVLTNPDEDAEPVARLRASVDAYLSYCRDHAHGVRMLYSGAGSSDPGVQAVVQADIKFQEDRILGAVSPDQEPHRLLRIAVRSWLAFLRAAAYDWLDAPDVPREDVCELCVSGLISTVVSLPEHAVPPALASP